MRKCTSKINIWILFVSLLGVPEHHVNIPNQEAVNKMTLRWYNQFYVAKVKTWPWCHPSRRLHFAPFSVCAINLTAFVFAPTKFFFLLPCFFSFRARREPSNWTNSIIKDRNMIAKYATTDKIREDKSIRNVRRYFYFALLSRRKWRQVLKNGLPKNKKNEE